MFCLLFFGFNLLAGCLGWIDFDGGWDVVWWCFFFCFIIFLIYFHFQLCGFFCPSWEGGGLVVRGVWFVGFGEFWLFLLCDFV